MGIYLNPRSERFQTSLRSEIYVDNEGYLFKDQPPLCDSD